MTRKRRVAIMIGLELAVRHRHQVFAGIQRYARENGNWECFIDPWPDFLIKAQRRDSEVDGIVGRVTPRLARVAKAAEIPLVNVMLNSSVRDVPCVFHDVKEGGRMAARHLLSRGFRSFGMLGMTTLRDSQSQFDGFSEVIRQRGYPVSKCVVEWRYDRTAHRWQRFQKKIEQWMATWPPTIGILVVDDMLCRYLAEVCRKRHIEIPRMVALVGTGNEELVDTVANPSLSSIDYGYEQIGHRAATLLDSLMDGQKPSIDPILMAPASLVVRKSSDVFVVEDLLVTKALNYIRENMHKEVAIDAVADHVATTRRTLSRHFQDSLKMTIHVAITHMRIERAKSMLLESKIPLKVVASECGFVTVMRLCKVFQRTEGISPGAYRSQRTTGEE